ncbi:hypothetical protein BDN70DRAFT_872348 [Pholiota conissans]|uniref:Uncharacterized protein n=1 Tax=Pholiota conissans TaxID=109636 RepID=A0A9P5ZCV0_9AGAR|nr:hypothetical protein BDN70DRAFT_872348 [Pholiota conissans]
MADICGVVAVTCLDICAGICLDFTSLRHSCTEDLCCCLKCGGEQGIIRLADTIPEGPEARGPLDTQPGTQGTMAVPKP